MLSLFCVLLVVLQPADNANRAMTPMTVNVVCIRFIFVGGPFWFDWVSMIIRLQGFLVSSFFCFTFVALLSHVCHFPKS